MIYIIIKLQMKTNYLIIFFDDKNKNKYLKKNFIKKKINKEKIKHIL